MHSWRLLKTFKGNYEVQCLFWFFPFIWWHIGYADSENEARERVAKYKSKPIYL